MLTTRTPFRASFLGGGTDIPWFFENHGGGAVISTSINKYMYLSAHPLFESEDILLKYSKIERVPRAEILQHPIANAVLSQIGVAGIDLSVSADVPAGTGLGSSSAFTVGLIHLMSEYLDQSITKEELAKKACEIELETLKEPIGKQDQYASAFGGLNLFKFQTSGVVDVYPLNVDKESISWLDSSLLLVKVGDYSRSASEMLRQQRKHSQDSQVALQSLENLRDLTLSSVSDIERDIKSLGGVLRLGWELKKNSHPSANLAQVDELIVAGLEEGALGAKLLGAGGGGFLLFLVEDALKARLVERFKPLATMEVGLDSSGSKLIYRD